MSKQHRATQEATALNNFGYTPDIFSTNNMAVMSDCNGLALCNRAQYNLSNITQITSAQLLALNTTPIQVAAAPGAGYIIMINKWVAWHGTGTAYAGIAAGEDLALKYTNASGGIAATVIESTGFLDQTTAQVRAANVLAGSAAASSTPDEITPAANAAIVLHLLSGNITTGNFALNVQVFYDILPVDLTGNE